jgi:spore germination cell wall hydrolase CwlJ-like protein
MLNSLTLPRVSLPPFARKHGFTSMVLASVVGLNAFAFLSLASFSDSKAVARVTPDLPGAVKAVPAPEPLQFRADVKPNDAVAINASVPVSDSPNPAASGFVLRAAGGIDRTRALDCLTAAIYYEAATAPLDGQRAVAQVVLNRVRHPAYPNTVCGVVWQGSERSTGCQFTFTCDGSLARAPMDSYWRRARAVAEAALAGQVYAPVGWATHYHTNWVVPYWSSSLVKVANVGTHIFYRWTGGWGRGPAFADKHAGVEPDVTRLGRRSPLPADKVDAMAAAAAEAAIGKLTPEQLADAEKGPDGKPLPPSSIDSFQRAVLRRYEPMPGSAVKSLLAEQARSADKSYSDSHMWAMSGGAAKTEPLGFKGAVKPAAKAAAKPEPAKTAEAKPEVPVLEGVRKPATYGPTQE